MLKSTQFCYFKRALGKINNFKIEAQAFEGGGFLNIFLRFLGFWGSFSYKDFSYMKKTL